MISAHEVQTAQFRRAGTGKAGYDENGVDDYLDRVVATLEAIERGGQMPADALSSHDVVDAVFAERGPQTSGGYDLDDVDDLLDRVAQRIHTYESGVRKAAAPVDAGLPQDADRTQERDGHDGRDAGVAAAGAAGGAAATREGSSGDDRDVDGLAAGRDRNDGDRDGRFNGGERRDEQGSDSRDGRSFGGERQFDERRHDSYTDASAPELQDSPRGDFHDDGGVRDGAALADAGRSPERDERGIAAGETRRDEFASDAARDERQRFDGDDHDARETSDARGVEGERHEDHRGAGLGAATAGGAVAAGAVAHAHRDDERVPSSSEHHDGFIDDARRDDQHGQGFENRGSYTDGLRGQDERGLDEPTVGTGELRGQDARTQGHLSHDDLTSNDLGRDQRELGDARGAGFAPSESRDDAAGRNSGVNMVGGQPADEAPIVIPDERGRGASDDARRVESRDEHALGSNGQRSAEERFDAERRDDVVRDDQSFGDRREVRDADGARGDDQSFGDSSYGRDVREDASRRDDFAGSGERQGDAHSNLGGVPAGAPLGAAAGGFAAQHHERDTRNEGGFADEGQRFEQGPEPVRTHSFDDAAPAAESPRSQHDAADFHDPATARSETFAEPGRDGGEHPFQHDGLRDETSGYGDAPHASGSPVPASEDERPIASEPQIVSYRATDRRVPLPRNDARSTIDEQDREAEAQYHPEFSSYATPESEVSGQAPGVQGGERDDARDADADVSMRRDEAFAPDAQSRQGFEPFEQSSRVSERPLDGHSSAAQAEGTPTAGAFGDHGTNGPQRVAPMNEEAARVREPHTGGGLEQPNAGRDPFADDARRDDSFDVAGGGDDVRRGDVPNTGLGQATTADAPGTAFEQNDAAGAPNTQVHSDAESVQGDTGVRADDGTRAQSVGRPESIGRPEPIDTAQDLPKRDDTSRKGLLRRIFKG